MPRIIGKEKKIISLRQKCFTEKEIGEKSSSEALSRVLLRGSITVEAALTMPLFLFAAAVVLSLFLMMQVQYKVGNALDCAVSDTVLLKQHSEKTVENLTKAAFYKELVQQKVSLSLIQGGVVGFSWKGTKVDQDSIDVSITYQLKFPIRFWGTTPMKISQGRRMHRWTGLQQKEGADTDGEWVFITPTQSVYHLKRDCTHLKLSVKSMGAAGLDKDGKYEPCGHCTKGQKRGQIVYVTQEGDCYHYKIDCSGLKRTIYMIEKSKIGGKRPCLRCSGN